MALRSCAACPGAAVSDPDFRTIPSVSPRHHRWKCPPFCRALFLSCHLLSLRSSIRLQQQQQQWRFPGARPSPTEGATAPRGSRAGCVRGNPRGRHTASQRLWMRAGSSSRTAVFRRGLTQVNKSPGLLPVDPRQLPLPAPGVPGASGTKHRGPAARAESGTEPPRAQPPTAPDTRQPRALRRSLAGGGGRCFGQVPQPSLRGQGRAGPSKPAQPSVPGRRLYRKVTQPRAPCCDSFIGISLALQRRVGFPPIPVLFARYKHSRNSNRFL